MIPRLLLAGSLLGAIAWLLGRRVFDVVEVEGSSMEPAYAPGDRLLVESISYRYRAPRPRDVVLARDPRRPTRELVKRVASVDPGRRTAVLVGDAPDASTDSRTFGPIPMAEIRWRVAARYWPIARNLPRNGAEESAVAEGGDAVDACGHLGREHVNV
jgi:nickel-type superoxide dismutase maturation protease